MLYERKGHCVKVSDRFIYLEELYLLHPGRTELYRSKRYYSTKFIQGKEDIVYNKELKCRVQRYWELEAAPLKYLEENDYRAIK